MPHTVSRQLCFIKPSRFFRESYATRNWLPEPISHSRLATFLLSNEHLFVLIRLVNLLTVAAKQRFYGSSKPDEQSRYFAHRL